MANRVGWRGALKNKIKASFSLGSPPGKALIHWQAPEFFFVDKSLVWGILVIIVFLALATLFVFLGQTLIAVLVVAFLGITLRLAYAKPQTLDYVIGDEGLSVAGWLHPYGKEIIGFWIDHVGRNPVVYFQTRNILTERFAIPLGDTSPKKVSRVLGKIIPEYVPPSLPQTTKKRKKK